MTDDITAPPAASPSDGPSAGRHAYRRHLPEFKLQVCREIRGGVLGRREAQKKYGLSDNLIQQWLAKYDRDSLVVVRRGDKN